MPCYGPINPETYYTHMAAMAAVAKFGIKVNPVHVAVSNKMALDTASNYLVRKALEEGTDYVFWTEMDMRLPEDVLPRLLDRGKDVCAGLYWLRGTDGDPQPCVYRKYQSAGTGRFGFTPVKILEYARLYRVDAAGMGCVLIKTDVFRRIAGVRGPWFQTIPDSCGQDMHFYGLCFEKGVEVWLDTGVRCDQEDGMTTIGPAQYERWLTSGKAAVGAGIILRHDGQEDGWRSGR